MGVLVPVGAHAHAVLVSSSPAWDETVKTLPSGVRLQFNEPVSVIRAAVRDAGGVSQNLIAASTGTVVTLNLPDPVGHGSVIVSYRVESEDGHPVGGSLVFHVGAASPAATDVAEAASSGLNVAIWLVHIATILYLAVFVGGALFNRWLDPGRALPVRPVAILVPGGLLLMTGLYLQGLDELGLGLTLRGLEPLKYAAHGNALIAAGLAFLSIVLISLPLTANRRGYLMSAMLAMATASMAFTFTGHCNVVEPRWLARTCIFLHGAAMLFWIGSLMPLLQLGKTRFSKRPLLAFSRAIPVPFVLMLAAGATLAFIELPEISQMLSSLYGQVLAVKIALVGILCIVAGYNRFWLTKPALAGSRTARMHLRRSIACEIALAIAIVGAASLWRFAGPAMAFVDEPATSLHLHSDKLMAQLELGRDPAGVTRARVVVMGPDFGPIGPRSVMLRLMNPEAGIEPIRYDLRKSSEGGWEGTVLALGDPAGWKVDVEVLIDDFTSAHLEGRLLK
jgi:copper transport protein